MIAPGIQGKMNGAEATGMGEIMEKQAKAWPRLRIILMIILPLIIIAFGFIVFGALSASKQKIAPSTPPVHVTRVDAVKLAPEAITLGITGYGTVRPTRETVLTAQVAGQVAGMAASFQPGAFVKEGDVLVTLKSREFEIDLSRADSRIAKAKAELDRLRKRKLYLAQFLKLLERKVRLKKKNFDRQVDNLKKGYISKKSFEEVEAAYIQDQETLLRQKEELDTIEPMIRMAEADLTSAETEKERAVFNLRQTEIRAPFSARVLTTDVEIGQSMAKGGSLGRLAYDGACEIPILAGQETMTKLAKVPKASVPEKFRHLTRIIGRPPATVEWVVGGTPYQWKGRLVRVEAFDTKTRAFPLIVEVSNPWASIEDNAPPLVPGYYCRVSIEGRHLSESQDVFVISESAIHENNQVYIAENNTLRLVPVKILQRRDNEAVVRSMEDSLNGKLLVKSDIAYPVPGMPLNVRIIENKRK